MAGGTVFWLKGLLVGGVVDCCGVVGLLKIPPPVVGLFYAGLLNILAAPVELVPDCCCCPPNSPPPVDGC